MLRGIRSDVSRGDRTIVLGIAAALAADHVGTRAHLDLCVGSELRGVRRGASWQHEGVQRVVVVSDDGVGEGREEVVHRHRLALGAQNEAHERKKNCSGSWVHGSEVLVDVEIRDHRDGPGGWARKIVQVDPREVRCRVSRNHVVGNGIFAHRTKVRLSRRQVHAVLVLQSDLAEVGGVTVARIDVTDGVRVRRDERRHATRALRLKGAGRPGDGRARTQRPRRRALL
mmetsp:Transcript_17536/g.39312  ORF Transcript_17536/g.39312 Transcript_17536/m.39312 type:complete len:228 (-) Transcript_17536:565-1248(-)